MWSNLILFTLSSVICNKVENCLFCLKFVKHRTIIKKYFSSKNANQSSIALGKAKRNNVKQLQQLSTWATTLPSESQSQEVLNHHTTVPDQVCAHIQVFNNCCRILYPPTPCLLKGTKDPVEKMEMKSGLNTVSQSRHSNCNTHCTGQW